MSVFVDTSAFFALLNRRDAAYAQAKQIWQRLLSERVDLQTTNYVVLETAAIAQRRLGPNAVRDLLVGLLLPVTVNWIGPETHAAAVAALLAANRRELSLVDCVSFDMMRELGIASAFTFDPHFREQGFEVLPSDQQGPA